MESMKKMALYGCNLKLCLSILLLLISHSYAQQRVLCYYANWSETRNASFRLYPWNIDISLCTHVVYAFAMPDLSEGVVPLDFLNTLNDDSSNEFVALKRSNPNLTLMLSIGGWQEGSRDFSQIAADPSAVKWITEILCQKVRNVGFDGLDINWQWPVPGLREGSNSADRENFVNLIRVMREYFNLEGERSNRKPLLLSVVLPPFKSYAEKGFDLNSIVREVDFVNLHSMDYHLSTAAEVNHLAPLYVPRPSSIPEPTVDSTVNMYLDFGIDPSMMNLGIPFYGFSYELEDPKFTDLKAPAEEEGTPGFGINTPGMLAYFEICKYVIDEKWTVNQPNETAVGPYAYHNRRWVGYDDTEIVRKKVRYAVNKRLGGITLMTIDMDDFNGICRERFPLTKAVTETLRNARQSSENFPQNESGNVSDQTQVSEEPPRVNVPVTTDILNVQPPPTPTQSSNLGSNSNNQNNFSSKKTNPNSNVPPVLLPRPIPTILIDQSIPLSSGLQNLPHHKLENPIATSINDINGMSHDGVIKTPGKFTYRATRMQFNKNLYY